MARVNREGSRTFPKEAMMAHARFIENGFMANLAHLIEECGEVLQAAGKTVRYGPFSVNPLIPKQDQETNLSWLLREMEDLRGAIDRIERAAAHDLGFVGCPIKAFVEDCVEATAEPGARIDARALFRAYLAWTRDRGRPAVSETRFGETVKRHLVRTDARVRRFEGVRLKADPRP